MSLRTLGQVRSRLARIAAVSGLRAQSAQFVSILNEAIEELMNYSDFPQCTAVARFSVSKGEFTLPSDFERAIGIAVDKSPVEMRDPWFEYMQWGTGVLDEEDDNYKALHRDNIPTALSVPDDGTNYQIRVKSDQDEGTDQTSGLIEIGKKYKITDYQAGDDFTNVGASSNATDQEFIATGTTPTDYTNGSTLTEYPNIIIRGYDQNSKYIRSTFAGERVDGEHVPIQTTENDTSSYFNKGIVEVIKPETSDVVRLYLWDGVTETEISAYKPSETVPSYKRYLIPYLKDDGSKTYTIQARCKLAFHPVSDDNDVLPISNIRALGYMIRAVHHSETGHYDDYVAARRLAVNLMDEEAKHIRGEVKSTVISVSEGGGNYIPDLR